MSHEPMSWLIECRLFDEQTMSHTVKTNEKSSHSMSPRSCGSLVLVHPLCGSFYTLYSFISNTTEISNTRPSNSFI